MFLGKEEHSKKKNSCYKRVVGKEEEGYSPWMAKRTKNNEEKFKLSCTQVLRHTYYLSLQDT